MKESTDGLQAVVFCAGETAFGADIRDVREIIRLDSITAIPGAAGHIEGVTNVLREKTANSLNKNFIIDDNLSLLMKFEGILERFPGLCVAEGLVEGLDIKATFPDLEAFKPEAYARIRSIHTIENVKDDPGYRAYRDFFWRVSIDPTKTRPASEALVRRILADKPLPTINTAVDAYNLASARSGVPIAAFDADRLRGGLTMRLARGGEGFRGIGMKEPISLQANQVVINDEERLIAVYPYRDSDDTKVTPGTKRMHVVSCGVPGISPDKVIKAYEMAAEYLEKYSDGKPGKPTISP